MRQNSKHLVTSLLDFADLNQKEMKTKHMEELSHVQGELEDAIKAIEKQVIFFKNLGNIYHKNDK